MILERFRRNRATRDPLDLRSPAFARDPYPFYERWLERGAVHYLPAENVWFVLSHELVSYVLRHPGLFSSSPFGVNSPSLQGADPPDHGRFRRILTPFFSREEQLSRRPDIERVAAHLIRGLKERSEFDAVSDLAEPFPFTVACDWLGLDETAAAELRQLPIADVRWIDVEPSLRKDGLLGRLARESDLGGAELAEMTGFFLLAGVSTARDFLLFALYTLLRENGASENALRGGIPASAVANELLRFEPPVHTLVRRTTANVALGGHDIPVDAIVWTSLAAANRDPSVFENPNEFFPGRDPSPHLSFGAGPHFCLGSHLGRLEGEVLLEALFPHLPTLRTVGPLPLLKFGGIPEALPAMRRMSAWRLKFA